MKYFPANRLNALQLNYFTVLEELIASREKQGRPVIRLDLGSPDLMPPDSVLTHLTHAAWKADRHGYQSHRGIPALRRAWAELYRDHHGIQLDPDSEVLPLIGTKEGIFHFSLTLINPGDLVLVPDPGYQTYRVGARFSGGEIFSVPCTSADQFVEYLQGLPEKTLQRVRLIWMNFPHNPTGAVADLDHFRDLAKLAKKYQIVLCQDSAYTRITYGGFRAPSLLEAVENDVPVLEFNSLSKSYNMAGWRVGAAVGSRTLLRGLHLLKSHADSGHFLPILEAAVQALHLDPAWINQRNARYQARRDLVIYSLRKMGIEVEAPRGGIYVWFPIPGEIPSQKCVQELVEHAGVALTPGTVFGDQGEGYLRLSLTSPRSRLQEGMERLSRGFAQLFSR